MEGIDLTNNTPEASRFLLGINGYNFPLVDIKFFTHRGHYHEKHVVLFFAALFTPLISRAEASMKFQQTVLVAETTTFWSYFLKEAFFSPLHNQ
jgi:hypothetical protein